MQKTVLLKASLLLGAFLVSFLIAEAVCRIVRPQLGTVLLTEKMFQLTEAEGLLYELRPNVVFHSEVEYRTNTHGMRDRERTRAKPENTRRLAILGDSITFGYWVDQQDVYPQKLESLIAARNTGPSDLEVLNFGVSGYNIDQEIATLEQKTLAFDPDVIVFGFCLNDFDSAFSYEYGLRATAKNRKEKEGPWANCLLPGTGSEYTTTNNIYELK